jgi:hypothetical protein
VSRIWPQLGNVHKDGSRFVGRDLGPVQPYADAGTPVLNKMVQTTIAVDVSKVHIGDRLDVRFDGGKHWWVVDRGTRVGRLPWSISLFDQKPWQTRPFPRIDDGALEVTRLLLNCTGVVINFGGIVRAR